MALARLNCGRWFEDQNAVDANSGANARSVAGDGQGTTVSNATTSEKSSVVGSGCSRFLGEYNPLLNLPLERRTMNTDVVLLPELTEALAALSSSEAARKHHKRKDDVKGYLDEVAKFTKATRFRK